MKVGRSFMRCAWLVGCCALFACSIYTEDLLIGSAEDGNCLTPDDCPATGSTCLAPTCSGGSCGVENVAEGTACSENGGIVCDGYGTCVECVGVEHCDQGQVCSNNACVDEGSLQNGEPCSVPAACFSGLCVDAVCCADACVGVCEACDVAGNLGTCTRIAAGADPDNECGADVCNGQGVCRCADGSKNGTETDVDCGGGACDLCGYGNDCNSGSDCLSGECQNTCLPGCGDNAAQGSEECDDGNKESFDGCSAWCTNPSGHLLLSEFVVGLTGSEFIEIYNPTAQTQSLSDIYLADFNTYYLVTQSPPSVGQYDFVVRFPQGATIASRAFVVVSLETASAFNAAYGAYPDFDLEAADGNAPAMLGQIGGNAGLTDAAEMIVLFRWNGSSDLVQDLDYIVYGNNSGAMDKTGEAVGAGTYLTETPTASQSIADNPTVGKSLHRCDTGEGMETESGSNGVSGHDETSEDFAATWKQADAPSPKGAPALGFCAQ